jgi:long-chain fatty acid transport protein
VVPHFFVNYRTGKLAYGLGVYVPYGLTSQWGDDFPGRFSAKKASLQTVYIQPNIAYQLNDSWSVGGGPIIGHSSVELVQGLDLSSQFAATGITFGNLGIPKYTEFGRATLKGDAMAYGAHLGVSGKIATDWQVGARFLTALTFSYDDADATFEQKNTGLVLAGGNTLGVPAGTPVDALVASQFTGSGALTAQKVATQITHPAQVQLGGSYTGFKGTTLSAEYAWTGWKSFRELPVNFQGPAKNSSRVLQEDYNNTSAFRLGAEHRLTNGVALRAGFTGAASAAPQETVTPLLPEQDRELLMFGAGLPIMSSFSIDASYAHIFTPGSRGRIDERATGSTTAQALALSSGVYTLNANIFAITLKYAH